MRFPRPGAALLGLAIAISLGGTGLAFRRVAATPTQDTITLLQTLEEWKYPRMTPRIIDGQMSDGGNPEIPDLLCKIVMTTTDPFEDVVAYYARKIGQDRPPQAVVEQDDSTDRPIRVKIFAVHRDDRSNLLVITRGETEKETHIAWTQYRRLPRR